MSFCTDGYFPDAGWFSNPLVVGTGPVGLTLAKAAEWYWRVKRWAFTFNITIDWEFTPPDVDPSSGSIAFSVSDADLAINAVDESDLVRGLANVQKTFSDFEVDGYFSGVVEIFNPYEFLDASMRKTGSTYYPLIQIAGGFTIGDSGGASIVLRLTDGDLTDVVCTIDGVDYPFYMNIEPEFMTAVIAGTITLEPVEYWPWERNGLPTWNTATGALLVAANTVPANYVELP